jgi:arsenate reductase (thioredoxin)
VWTLLRVLGKAACYALPGGAVGTAAGGLIGSAVGFLAGSTEGAFADGALLGAVVGALTGAMMSDPFEGSWVPGGVDGLPARLEAGGWGANPNDAYEAGASEAEAPAMPAGAGAPTPHATRPVVLFLCTGNSARSQMAEAFLRRYAADLFAPYSAGTEARGIHPLAARVMGEAGVDISGQRSKALAQLPGRLTVGVAVTVCRAAEPKCPTRWPGARTHLYWPFEDPSVGGGTEEEQLERFRFVRDQIDGRIRGWLTEVGVGAARTASA